MMTNYHLTKVLVEDRQRALVAAADAVKARRTARQSGFGRWFARRTPTATVTPLATPAIAPTAPTVPTIQLLHRPDMAPAGRPPAGAEGRAA